MGIINAAFDQATIFTEDEFDFVVVDRSNIVKCDNLNAQVPPQAIAAMWALAYPVPLKNKKYAHLCDEGGAESSLFVRKPAPQAPASTLEAEEDVNSCPICMEEYNAGDMLLTAECNHTFHADCLKQAVAKSG